MAPPKYRSGLRELAQKTRGSAGLRDEHLLAAGRTSVSALTITDLASTIAGEFEIRQREILKHVNRMIQHAVMKSAHERDDLRVRNLHKRLFQVEAELRRLTRMRSL